FQSLNKDEIILLHNYYQPNITPILVMEVMADLKKEIDKVEKSEKRVIDFANKLLPYNSGVNLFFMEILVNDLLHGNTPIEHTPLLGSSEMVETTEGKKGFHIKESPQEEALSRWRSGNFNDSEKELAALWREYTTQKDLLENLKENLKNKLTVNEAFKSLDEVKLYIEELIEKPEIQTELLVFIISEFGINNKIAAEILLRWEQTENKLLKEFAPYALFCCKVKLIFDFALRHSIVGTRPTNMLDLQYLYYLPFCKVFSTNDKFQKSIANLLIDSKQKNVDGTVLKADLKKLVEYRATLFEKKDIERTKKEPPQIPDTLTYQLWNEYFDWPSKIPPSKEKDKQYYKDKMDEFIKAKKPGSPMKDIDETEFIVMERYYRPIDLCPCGSGKMFKDCCLPKDYFEQMRKKHSG
ncbi:MAG: SEC-C domain-containing protein, partial [Bacteroidales bacterium]|nr:SEC-C domain-containing protein [Bacteroidales bacterium]